MKRSRTIRRALESFGEALKKDECEDNRLTPLFSLKLSACPMPSLGKWPFSQVFIADEANWKLSFDLPSSTDEPLLSTVIPSSPLLSSLSSSSSATSISFSNSSASSSSSEKKRKKSDSFDYSWLEEPDGLDNLAEAFAFATVDSSYANEQPLHSISV